MSATSVDFPHFAFSNLLFQIHSCCCCGGELRYWRLAIAAADQLMRAQQSTAHCAGPSWGGAVRSALPKETQQQHLTQRFKNSRS